MKKVSGEELLEKIKLGKVLVKFGAPWCAPCKTFNPVLEEYSVKHPEILVLEIDIDEDIEVAKKYGVNSLPTIILFFKSTEVKRSVGVRTLKSLEDFVEEIY